MAMGSGSSLKLIAITLMVVGIRLVLWGHQFATSVGSQFTQAVTASNTDKVMNLYIAGAVSIVFGIYLFAKY
ncbi:MAG: hypothetical protein COS35_04935 [Zetaproteobacteria bacterium CG02_land_8_20_14_3_00_50_9]|nr:MAG: hypothetical protein AUJ56_12690 [Zetaproteobacteria bacterium CG1_02_49_23]PIQ34145.1 MAG: hypothetical protein COW62_02980 [Zetaproteobacteria bacterium CG17_big_fil_post_rev_8_21_14_2_50_50_13]PIV30771.1 MAG: hypothetical protein COS35_04935 [Zetaproteobacteria bacterium CG02_land_8_20_14_3_00_50_9]PIY54967.1 MAG: hypothetical protein COZ00_11945 [Zetaproteobacteria bacterium CG_4_10_14_0_8_um_filter_49_80]